MWNTIGSSGQKAERLVYKHDPEKGTEPVNFQVTVTFTEENKKTKVTVQMLFPSAAAREHVIRKYGADEGLKQTLERLAEQLAKMLVKVTNLKCETQKAGQL